MNNAAVIGLGTMGPGIAATLARAGLKVSAFDSDGGRRERAGPGFAAAATGAAPASDEAPEEGCSANHWATAPSPAGRAPFCMTRSDRSADFCTNFVIPTVDAWAR